MTPRRLAVKALIHQEQAGYANLVLDAELKKCDPPMNTRDAAFAARIFYTTLERLPLLDYIRLILAGKSHEHIAIRKMLTFLVEIRGNK